MKKFFKKTEGFTLVELIVVIAILGILAGVGTVGYSGYIKKANMAADQQLLASLNTAFSVACIENGVDSHSLTDAHISVQNDGTVDEASLSVTHNSLSADACDAAFAKYFEGGQFKVCRRLIFSNGIFVDPENGAELRSVSLPGGGKVYMTEQQFEKLNASTYKGHISTLMNQIDGVAGLVEALLDGAGENTTAIELLGQFMADETHLTSMIKALGGNAEAGDLSALQGEYARVMMGLVDDKIKAGFAEELEIEIEDVTQEILDDPDNGDLYERLANEATTEIQKNMLVMGIAQNAVGQSASGVMGIIKSETPKQDLINAMKDTSNTNGMGQAALVYGVFTAYAKSASATDEAKAAINNASDPTAVFDILENESELEKFQTYMDSDQGQKDLDACIAAMGVIGNTTADGDAVTGVLNNGFANAEFIAALESFFE